MALKIRPKRFGPVFVRFDGVGGVTFATDANGPDQLHPPYDKPVLTMMASVGHCLVESIRIVASRENAEIAPFAISVVSEKALDMPGRLQSIRCLVHGKLPDTPGGASNLVKQAKAICTVSNTLNCDITVELGSAELSS